MYKIENQDKVCSFFGHRKIDKTEKLKQELRKVIEDLIVNHCVTVFLFGSRSEFDELCHLIVTHLKEKYIHIKRISYTCRCETCTLECEKEKWEKIYSNFFKRDIRLLGVEEEFEHETKYTSGRANYVERNQAMINNSDYCVFYYDKNYLPAPRKYSKRNLGSYQPKSGTAIAYAYAKQKKKIVLNIMNYL